MSQTYIYNTEAERGATVDTGNHCLTGEERLLARIVEDTWKDLHSKSETIRREARAFMNSGMEWLLDPSSLDYNRLVASMERIIPDAREHGNPRVAARLIRYNGVERSCAQWAAKLNLSDEALRRRIRKYGMTRKTFTRYNPK